MQKGVVMILVSVTGCAKVPVGFDAPSEIRRIDAVVAAAAEDDQSPETVRSLIEQLDSFDPAMRMLAIRTLERMTGRTMGYDHAAPRWSRGVAIDRWVAWYGQEYPGSAPPTDEASTRAGDE